MKLSITVEDIHVAQLLESAGVGIRYWCTNASGPLALSTKRPIRLTLRDDFNGRSHVLLTRLRLRKAIEACASKAPLIFARLMAGNIDGPGADIIVQLAVFGLVIYA